MRVAPGRWPKRPAAMGRPVLQVSTDYVFDGAKASPYVEDDAVGPLGVYGRSKLGGEQAVAAANPRHAILRTAWVYAPYGSNFVRTMLRIAANKPEVAVVADQYGCPTSALDIASTLIGVAERMVAEPDNAALTGVFHMAARGEAVWADVAEAIFATSRKRGGPAAKVNRITTAEFPTQAERPANSRLDCGKLERVYGLVLPSGGCRSIVASGASSARCTPLTEFGEQGGLGVKPPVSPETLVRIGDHLSRPVFRFHGAAARGAGAQDQAPLRASEAAPARGRRGSGSDRRDGRTSHPRRPHRRCCIRPRPGRGPGPQGLACVAHQDGAAAAGHRHRTGERCRGRGPRRGHPGPPARAAQAPRTLPAGRARALPATRMCAASFGLGFRLGWRSAWWMARPAEAIKMEQSSASS